jgi:hypothetical protein
LIAAQPKEVIQKKQFLFYSESDGRNFLKFLADKLLKYLSIAAAVFGICWLGIHYWKINSKNERFKYTYFWLYQQHSKKTKQFLFDTYKEFENDSIFDLKKKDIPLYYVQNVLVSFYLTLDDCYNLSLKLSLTKIKKPDNTVLSGFCGAQNKTRTCTPLRAPAPQAGVSTNFTTWAE